MRGGNSSPKDEVYPWNRWYTRRSFALWSMLRVQNPSCVSALKKCDNVDLQQSRQPSLGLWGGGGGGGVERGTQIVYWFVLINFLLNVSCFLIELDPLTCSLFYEPLHLKNVYNNLTNGSLEVKILHNGAHLLVGSGRFNWQDKDSYLVAVTFKSKTRRNAEFKPARNSKETFS